MSGPAHERPTETSLNRPPSAKELSDSLRIISMPEIFAYINENWDPEHIRVKIAKPGNLIHVPSDWHGSEKFERVYFGDAQVMFGLNLIEPIEGTRLPPEGFIDGLRELHFTLEDGNGKQLNNTEATKIISSDAMGVIVSPDEEIPIFRAILDEGEGKIIIEVRNGSMSPVMQELTNLGNDPSIDPDKKLRYRQAVSDCLGGFCAKGATAVRNRLQLNGTKRLTYFDDCLASGATILGDQEVDRVMGRSHDNMLEEIRVAVASTQGISIAIQRSLDRNVPLLVRVGAISYGLGNRTIGSNYLINTQPEMLDHGLFTVGDMGDHLSTGREGIIHPHICVYRPKIQRSNNETRIYLGGGLAMLRIWEERIRQMDKEPDSYVHVLQASRVNPPPQEDGRIHDWGVLFNGKTIPPLEPNVG